MDTKKLRHKILDLAIHGKLVPQDPNDEPASVLLERISNEKERLIKAGKIKRNKQAASSDLSSDDVPFELPEGWCWCRLESLVQFINGDRGSNYPSKDKLVQKGNIPFVSAINITSNSINEDNLLYLSDEQYNLLGSGKLKKNDIVLCIRGSLGKHCIYPFEIGAIASSLVILRSYEKRIIDFISYYIDSELFNSEIKIYNNGTAQPNLAANDVMKFHIPLPPLAEQKRIVSAVEQWMSVIDVLENNEEDLRQSIDKAKSKILDLAIRGKLVPQDFNDEPASELLKRLCVSPDNCPCEDLPFELPEGWCWLRHNEVIEISGGAQPPKSNFITSPQDGYIQLYQIRDYGEKPSPVYIPTSQASKIANKGDILLARYGASLGKVFKAEYGAYNVAMAKVILRYENLFYTDFLFLYYHTELYRSVIFSVSRSAQNGFNKADLESMVIPLPPLAEQHRIVAKIEQLYSQLDEIESSLQ